MSKISEEHEVSEVRDMHLGWMKQSALYVQILCTDMRELTIWHGNDRDAFNFGNAATE